MVGKDISENNTVRNTSIPMVKIHESSLNSSDMGELASASDSKTFDAVSDTLQAEKEFLPEKDLSDQDNAREEPGQQTDNDENVEIPTESDW